MFHIKQRMRCSRTLGHFWKWKLGDGENCPWCHMVRKFPRLNRWIPYSYDPIDNTYGYYPPVKTEGEINKHWHDNIYED